MDYVKLEKTFSVVVSTPGNPVFDQLKGIIIGFKPKGIVEVELDKESYERFKESILKVYEGKLLVSN